MKFNIFEIVYIYLKVIVIVSSLKFFLRIIFKYFFYLKRKLVKYLMSNFFYREVRCFFWIREDCIFLYLFYGEFCFRIDIIYNLVF